MDQKRQAKARRHLMGVQALRGIGALLVMIAHLIEHQLGQAAPVILRYGGCFGVALFFVISGFVIQHASGDRQIDPAAFAVRRIARVVPLYWVTTLLVAVIAIAAPQLFHSTRMEIAGLWRSLLFIPYADAANSNDWHPLFKPGWTLNYEMAFYTAVLCLFWCRSALGRALGLTLLIGGLLLLGAILPNLPGPLTFYARFHLGLFLAGVWIAEAWRINLFSSAGRWLPMLAVPAAAVLTILFYLSHIDIMMMMLASVALLVAALSLEHGPERRIRVIGWIGDISYSIYLLHMFVVGAVWAVAHKLISGEIGAGVMVVVVGTGAIMTLVLADISYRWFESPISRLGERIAHAIETRRTLSGRRAAGPAQDRRGGGQPHMR